MTVHRFETPGPVRVRVINRWGPIDVRSDPAGGVVEVELVPVGGDRADEMVADSLVEHEEVAGRHRIDVEIPRRRMRPVVWRSPVGEIRVRLSVPEGADVELTTASKDLACSGRFGRVEATTGSGDVAVAEVAGELVVRTASGEVTVERSAGSADVQTASGDIRCDRLEGTARLRTGSGDVVVGEALDAPRVKTGSGDVALGVVAAGATLETASGDLRIDRLVSGRAELSSASGRIVVGIAEGTGVRVDATSVTGQLTSEIDLDEEPPPGADDDGPIAELAARSVSGDVRLRRARP